MADGFVLKLAEGSVYSTVPSLEGLASALRTCPANCIRFHMRGGLNDFAVWSSKSLKREDVALKLKAVRLNESNVEETRRLLLDALSSKQAKLK